MYQIKERFFNIWYLIRFGGEKGKAKVKGIISFLENWCNRKQLEGKEIKYIDKLIDKELYEYSLDEYEEVNLFFKFASNTDEYNKSINEYFILLMAKKQYNSLLKLFNENEFNLKDKFKPTYYSLMYFMKNQNGKFEIEYRKVGEELMETVEEIIEEVKKVKEKYNENI